MSITIDTRVTCFDSYRVIFMKEYNDRKESILFFLVVLQP